MSCLTEDIQEETSSMIEEEKAVVCEEFISKDRELTEKREFGSSLGIQTSSLS
jgi:hypothetical protein